MGFESTSWWSWIQCSNHWKLINDLQGLRASSLQFTSPLEFNTIFRDGFTLRLELNGGSKIRDPVTAKFKHVTVLVTCTLLCCDDVTYMPALSNFQKADLEPYPYGKKYTTFSFPIHGALASNICLRDAPTCSCIQLCSPRKSDENVLILTFLWIKTNFAYTRLEVNNVLRYKYSLSPASNWFVTLFYIIASSTEFIFQTWPLAI